MIFRSITTSPLALSAALAAPLAVAIPSSALAGAFQIREGSAAAQGASFAGRTSGDRDVSFALHNPAALRTVERFEAAGGRFRHHRHRRRRCDASRHVEHR
jgi:long-subunit fatty acid transport protein